MQKNLVSLAAGLLAAGASAQSLQLVNANSPGIYCHFDPNCNVSSTAQSDTFTPTNLAATCVLESRSFPGNSQDSQGQYGFEYRITLNNIGALTTDTNILTVDSLTLKFGVPVPFAFGLHASNQVWVVASGGPIGLAPGSADLADDNVTIHFNPPLMLQTDTDQTTNTCYFGLISDKAPESSTAVLSGSTQDPVDGKVPFTVFLNAQAP